MDPFFSNELQVDRKALRPLRPIKSNWKINDSCEFKSPKDNKLHMAIITNFNYEIQTFTIIILSTKEEWTVKIEFQHIYIRPLYDDEVC